MTSINVRIQDTDYEGDDFPEASSYPQYVAECVHARLAAMGIAANVECDGGHSETRVFGIDDHAVAEEIREFVQYECWDAFCADGYKAFSEPKAPGATTQP